MPVFLTELMNSFAEIHYFIAGVSVGMIIGIAITLTIVWLVFKIKK